jgi:hypothetical protein
MAFSVYEIVRFTPKELRERERNMTWQERETERLAEAAKLSSAKTSKENNKMKVYDDVRSGVVVTEYLEFKPSAEELFSIAKHYYRTELGIQSRSIFFECISRIDSATVAWGNNRIASIAAILGEDAVKAAYDDVRSDISKSTGPVKWQLFLDGEGGKL